MPANEVLHIEPRGLRRPKAAAYINVSQTKFDELVKDGRMPRPKRIDACKVWDRRELDEAFEALPHDDDGDSNPWGEVLS
jgi:predicted DNA-binding transcriptional regulator AlpA